MWGGSLVCKMLVSQAREPAFHPQHQDKKLGLAYNPRIAEVGTGGSLEYTG